MAESQTAGYPRATKADPVPPRQSWNSHQQSPGLLLSVKKYVNIPSEKYIYVNIYVCICVYTYLCKMDERRSYASLS